MLRGLEARLAATEAQGRITAVDAELIVDGSVDDQQRVELRAAAENCRISRALSVPVTARVRIA